MFLVGLIQILLLDLLDGPCEPTLLVYGFVDLAVAALADLVPYIIDLCDIFLVDLNNNLLSVNFNFLKLSFKGSYFIIRFVV